MLKLKPWLADFFGVLTPQDTTAGVFQARQQLTIYPTLTPNHAPDGCMANPGFRAEVAHGRNCARIFQHLKHVLDVSGHLDGASKHGVFHFDLAKSRPLITPREIAGTSGWGASGHTHQSKGEK